MNVALFSSFSVILAYLAVLCLAGGLTWRIYLWNSTGSSAMRLGYFPKPAEGIRPVRITADTFFFSQVAEINPAFWLTVVLFHLAMFTVFIGHLHLFVPYPGLLKSFLNTNADFIGLTAGMVWSVTIIYLIARRLRHPMNRISTTQDFILLVLLLSIIISGINVRLHGGLSPEAYRGFAHSLVTLHPQMHATALNAAPLTFPIHIILASVLLIYFPFSKLIHFVGAVITNSIRRK